MDDSRDVFDEIAALFVADAPPHMQHIKEGLLQRDSGVVRRSAHTLKGMAGIFAAERTLRAAERVEHNAGLPECGEAAAQLDAALSELIAAIKAYQW